MTGPVSNGPVLKGKILTRQILTSAAINTVMSATFFLLIFGPSPHLLHWGPPDRLATDFMPQSAIVALMSALVPVLVARRQRTARGEIGLVRPVVIVVRALGFALGGLLLGAFLAYLSLGAAAPVDWIRALALKCSYGGLLGGIVTTLALRGIVA